ncbi:MAG: hypothetical protein FWE10_00370 [Rikenellaceae bacterium]|nr:hypothetical protein [Rikenellaceae bacterium]MCL2692193.1 hypothetical protein [Rikenellaceae bacterium]
MTDYDYGYGYDDEYGQENQPSPRKTIRGYQFIIIALAGILGVLSFIYFRQMNNLKEDFDIERRHLNAQFAGLMSDYDELRSDHDTINIRLAEQRHIADSLMESLANERRLNVSRIRQYEREIGTLRSVMREYVVTIDSLNTVNTRLASENVSIRRDVQTERLRAQRAEETASELSQRVQRGSVILARGISLSPVNRNGREVSRVNNATALDTGLTLAANELAQPGVKPVYVRIIGPDGYVLANSEGRTFTFEGEGRIFSAVREVDYQNDDLGVVIHYPVSGIGSGTYKVEVYVDGRLAGTNEINLR